MATPIDPRDCSGCIFQRRAKGIQTGCLCSYSNVEEAEYELHKGSFFFKEKLCQYKRPDGWKPELSLEGQIQEARKEVTISWTLCYTPEGGLVDGQQLRYMESLLKSKLPPTKVMCLSRQFDKGIINKFPEIEFLMLLDDDLEEFLSQHHTDHFLCISQRPKEIGKKFFSELDVNINERGNYFSLIESAHTRLFSGKLWDRNVNALEYLDHVRENGESYYRQIKDFGEFNESQ